MPAEALAPYFTAIPRHLYMAMELAAKKWLLAFSDGSGRKPRITTIEARSESDLLEAVHNARRRFDLSRDVPVKVCMEAGRDGFSVYRLLTRMGFEPMVIDPASVEVNQRKRRVKTDRVDVRMLLDRLQRYAAGDHGAFQLCRIPTVEQEDERQLHRERERLVKERTQHRARIKSALATMGIRIEIRRKFLEDLDELVTLWGEPLPPQVKTSIVREYDRMQLVAQQIRDIDREMTHRIEEPVTENDAKARLLFSLRGVGIIGATTVTKEFLGWRDFKNRREVGGASGLTGTPYNTGMSSREQGISKAGNRRIRRIMVELGWAWLRFQPDSKLSKWFFERFDSGGKRGRRKGIVALARRLLIELWKLLKYGVIPVGAITKPDYVIAGAVD